MDHHQRVILQLRPRIAQWRLAFSDEVTGIHRTLDQLLWSYACFRIVIKIVSLANERRLEDVAPINHMLFQMVADGFWAGLLVGTRRLIDPAGLRGERGVYSIRSVVEDVEACASKLTRKIYVEEVWNGVYDTSAMEAAHWERLREAAQKHQAVWGNPRLRHSQMAQETFDILSGKGLENRTEDDLIRPDVFEGLKSRLERLDGIKAHVDTHLVHSGNASRRASHTLEEFDIRSARQSLRDLKTTADLAGMWFAGISGAGLAYPQGDLFEGLETPLVGEDDVEKLEQLWDEISRDIASWGKRQTAV